MKKGKKRLMTGLFIILVICTGLIYWHYGSKPKAVSIPQPSTPEYNFSRYSFELFRTSSYIFSCDELVGTESQCWLSVTKINGEPVKDQQISTWDPQKNFIVSPDKNKMLIVNEQDAYIYDLNHPEKEPVSVLSVTADKALGTYTAFPTFEGEARWVDDKNVKISIYPAGTSNEGGAAVKPLEVRNINI